MRLHGRVKPQLLSLYAENELRPPTASRGHRYQSCSFCTCICARPADSITSGLAVWSMPSTCIKSYRCRTDARIAYPKFKLTSAEQQELLSDYLPWCTTVHVSDVPFEMPLCRDPFDLPFLQLATAGKADYLVTGDADLLCLSDQFVPPIITADDFMKMLDG